MYLSVQGIIAVLEASILNCYISKNNMHEHQFLCIIHKLYIKYELCSILFYTVYDGAFNYTRDAHYTRGVSKGISAHSGYTCALYVEQYSTRTNLYCVIQTSKSDVLLQLLLVVLK